MKIDSSSEVVASYDGPVLTLTLNRPHVLNAINDELLCGLTRALELSNEDESLVVVLTGAGRAFCAGGDHGTLRDQADGSMSDSWRMERHVARMMRAYADAEKPIIAAVNGPAIGLGATLALYCDYIVMASDATIGDRHVSIGLVPGVDSTIWTALLGPLRAKELLMTGRLLSGEEAARFGLVNKSVPATELTAAAQEYAETLAALPPYALRKTKASVNRYTQLIASLTVPQTYAWEQLSMMTSDHREAMTAFKERRPGAYSGS